MVSEKNPSNGTKLTHVGVRDLTERTRYRTVDANVFIGSKKNTV